MLPMRELCSNFIFKLKNLILNATKIAGVNNVAILFDRNRVNQGFFKMFQTKELWLTTTNNMFLFFLFFFIMFELQA